jgi:hypothetical protein
MSRSAHAHRVRLQVEALGDRTVPGTIATALPAAFQGLEGAVTR